MMRGRGADAGGSTMLYAVEVLIKSEQSNRFQQSDDTWSRELIAAASICSLRFPTIRSATYRIGEPGLIEAAAISSRLHVSSDCWNLLDCSDLISTSTA
jgi:hypothetical protein